MNPDDATRTNPLEPSAAPQLPASEERFVPGTLVAGRYRIATLLGQGGMGEVYRATDLKLGQPVALKFLPPAFSRNPHLLERFYNEVRVARQVSHPNVCRVHDLGDVDGHAYLSMEFIDGEDVASLLRRIGRLPSDKALEMARQLCAGLAAAHDQGVLHRDLKPANIMIDGRGQLHIMDFGLAAAASNIGAGDIRSGTLSYMAPEQIEGREVSRRSDIYALGLVLYEMFTGQRPFRAGSVAELREKQDTSRPDSMTSAAADIDPGVERAVLRCLAPDPADRPSSARVVAAALPGGDPLAAALAAGETPSPDLVAASGENSGLSPRSVAACLAIIVAGLAMLCWIGDRTAHLTLARPERSPDVLAAQSRDLLRELGFPVPADSLYSYELDQDFVRHVHDLPAAKAWLRYLDRPGAIRFYYRESPRPLVSSSYSSEGFIRPEEPPLSVSGMVNVKTDVHGRLVSLESVPPQRDPTPAQPGGIDWTVLFEAAGLDPSRFHNVDPEWQPLAGWDARAAWEGSFERQPSVPIRVEAGAWRGKPTHFYVMGPWTRPGRMESAVRTGRERAMQMFQMFLLFTLAAGMLIFARHNLKQGRGDRRGAFTLGLVVFISYLLTQALGSHHVAGMEEMTLVSLSLALASVFAVSTWISYLALEPPVRRRWPTTLISWSRLLAGRWRDPVVGKHILLGLAGSMVIHLGTDLMRVFPEYQGGSPAGSGFPALLGLRHALGYIVATLSLGGAFNALLNFFLLFLFRLVLRKDIPTAVVFVLLFSILNGMGAANPWVGIAGVLFANTVYVFLLLRFGLLSTAAAHFVMSIVDHFHLTLNFAAWYAPQAWVAIVAVVMVAGVAARVALAGRPLFDTNVLDR